MKRESGGPAAARGAAPSRLARVSGHPPGVDPAATMADIVWTKRLQRAEGWLIGRALRPEFGRRGARPKPVCRRAADRM